MHLRTILLATACLMAALVHSQQQSCMLNDAEMLKQRRLRNLRTNILAQLGISEPELERNKTASQTPTPNPAEEEAVRETFEALRNASVSLEREKERKCSSDDFFAKPVTSFVGFMQPEELVTNDLRRQADGDQETSSNILNSYAITLNFDLPQSHSVISRADLLLWQLPSLGRVNDRNQYVEIKTVLESVGQKFIVEGKYIDIYDSGYQVFDITSAAKLWVASEINGSVGLEVTVYCYSSPNCGQAQANSAEPARIQFMHATDDSTRAPRIIVTSKNPIEVDKERRFRRQAQQGAGVGFCTENRTTCCLKPLSIDFREDLGFDFVIQPKRFPANYCEGFCPEVSEEYMTPQLFEFLSRLGDSSPAGSIEPCCAGNTYQSLEVLMRVNGVLIIEELQQVTVNSCRCA